MIERGIVVQIDGQRVAIRCSVGECAACGSCSRDKRDFFIQAVNQVGFDLRRGDEVEVDIGTGRAVLSGFLVLILPLLMFFPFYGLPALLFEAPPEPLRVIAGLGGVAAGFLLNLLWARRKNTQELPRIVRLIHRDAPQAVYPDS